MGRSEPCVLFAHSFVHPKLDEYVDEVIFAEPVVITACEFIEHNTSSASTLVTIVGATSPPSFGLEFFVKCEGEARFRRLSQPFLYSHSSSNILEIEAVVSSHLVVRGTYRCLSMVIYGNTAEDLGQRNIDFEFDSSIASLVSTPLEGRLEDLPSVLRSSEISLEDSLCSLKNLTIPIPGIEIQVKKLLLIIFNLILEGDFKHLIQNLAEIFVSSITSYVSSDLLGTVISFDPAKQVTDINCKKDNELAADSQMKLHEVCEMLLHSFEDRLKEGSDLLIKMELDAEQISPKMLDVFLQCFFRIDKPLSQELNYLHQNERVILGLCLIFLFCHGKDGCFYLVSSGGLQEICSIFSKQPQNTTAVTLMLLGVIERATQHAIGCEGFLGWTYRDDENVRPASSQGYNHLVELLLRQHRHEMDSLVAYILNRLGLYETASMYESAVVSALAEFSTSGSVTKSVLQSLALIDSLLKKLVKFLNAWKPAEEPLARTKKSFMVYEHEGVLSYKSTVKLIAAPKWSIAEGDIDTTVLSLLKERKFLLLSCALLSSPLVDLQDSIIMDMLVEVTASVEAILFLLLSSRSGLIFLLQQKEVAIALVHALKGTEEIDKTECVPVRYANVLVAKGFICRTLEAGTIAELHMKVVNAVDRLLSATPQTEEFLWILWELCTISRTDVGRQALLALGRFPEAVLSLIEALRSVKEFLPDDLSAGSSPINLAILYSAAEIFEVLVSDSTPFSLASWIDHSMELHKALHMSSPGSNRRDAPTRLLEWIDAGVVYRRSGAAGLLRYAAVLASGRDAHLSSASILVSDSLDVENVVGDSSSGSDVQVIENLLGKLVSDKDFEGFALRESVIVQLTAAVRILASIAENSTVAGALYEENAVTIIYVILVNCKFMLELSSSTYDYLVDEGPESNSGSNLPTERGGEQSLVDLMIPTLSLLNLLLRKLQALPVVAHSTEAKAPHRNRKLLKALLKLHKEVSPKLAASAPDMSTSYPKSALGLGAVCRLIVSALASWPIFGWSPGLFLSLRETVKTSSQLTLGPKEACSFLWILCDLFPEEEIWLWRSGLPYLSILRRLSIAAVLGEEKEAVVDWHLTPNYMEKLLSRFDGGFVDDIAEVTFRFAVSALSAIQDILRILIVRIASQKVDYAVGILKPTISWMRNCVNTSSSLPDTDIFKMGKLLEFISSLLEHPHSKVLLLKEDMVQILTKAMEICYTSLSPEGMHIENSGFNAAHWFHPICKSVSLICDTTEHAKILDSVPPENWTCIARLLLKLCQILPPGKELLDSLVALRGIASFGEDRKGLSFVLPSHAVTEQEKGSEMDDTCKITDEYDWMQNAPLYCCLKSLLKDFNINSSVYLTMECAKELLLCMLYLCKDGKNVRIAKILFGLSESDESKDGSQEKLQDVTSLIILLSDNIEKNEHLFHQKEKSSVYQVKVCIKLVLQMLQDPTHLILEEKLSADCLRLHQDVSTPTKLIAPHIRISSFDDESEISVLTSERSFYTSGSLNLNGFMEQYLWECSDASLPTKRKNTSSEAPNNKRARGESSVAEYIGANYLSRATSGASLPSNPVRRDTFRQRKPNTSRPPSMHVDDYVARERVFDGTSTGQVQRGISGGRPPSIHVDEFMARQRERQNPGVFPTSEVMVPQSRNSPGLVEESLSNKPDKPRQMKTDLDDDIDIVFDMEPDTDDKLPFAPVDDTIQPALLQPGEPAHSIVEETESNQNVGSRNDHFSAAESHEDYAPKQEKTLTREESLSSVNFPPSSKVSSQSGMPPISSVQYYEKDSTLSPATGDSRLPPAAFSSKESPKQAAKVSFPSMTRRPQDKLFSASQPARPPFPPPIPAQHSQHAERVRDSSNYPYNAQFNAGAQHTLDARHAWASGSSNVILNAGASPSSSSRPVQPPLPPMPPPYASQSAASQIISSNLPSNQLQQVPLVSQSLNDGRLPASYSLPSHAPPSMVNRPSSSGGSFLAGAQLHQQQIPNAASPAPSLSNLQSMLSVQPHPHSQYSNPSDVTGLQQNPIYAQGQLLQPLQQMLPPQMPVYYQMPAQQPEMVLQPQPLVQVDPAAQQPLELASLFTPESLHLLLKDKERLCLLLERHPKLMEMLQEKLGPL